MCLAEPESRKGYHRLEILKDTSMQKILYLLMSKQNDSSSSIVYNQHCKLPVMIVSLNLFTCFNELIILHRKPKEHQMYVQ